jgi:hypothetical protein
MKNLLLTVLAFGLLSSSAFGEEQSPQGGLVKKQYNRVVASGTKQQIGFFGSLNPDCTVMGNVTVRVTKKPDHGTVDVIAAMSFPGYPKDSDRYKCNQHRVKGMQINYKSAEKYVGDDAFDLLVLFPSGNAWEARYDVSVR